MKRIYNRVYPLSLIATLIVFYLLQHWITNLPYLPFNQVVPLAILVPLFLLLTCFTAYSLFKKARNDKPVSNAVIVTVVAFLLILIIGIFFLNYVENRFAAPLPKVYFFNIPTGYATMGFTATGVILFTSLMIYGLVKEKSKASKVVFSVLGWIILNACLVFLTI